MEVFQTKDKIEFYPFLKATKNSAKSVTVAQLTVPFGTVRWSAGLRPGTKLENIEHPTSNAEHRSFRPFLFNSMLGVQCSMSQSETTPGRRPALQGYLLPGLTAGFGVRSGGCLPVAFQGVTTR